MIHEIHEAPGEVCSHGISVDLEAIYQLHSSSWIYIDTGAKDGSEMRTAKES